MLFFGREWEARELTSLIVAKEFVAVCGPSGAGKTSLMNAGVIPLLRASGIYVLAPVRPGGPAAFTALDPRTGPPPTNPFVANVVTAWLPGRPDDPAADLTLSDALACLPVTRDDFGEIVTRVMVLDQFEELFTKPAFWRERDAFFESLRAAIRRFPELRVVCLIRSDYLAQFELYGSALPSRWRAFRLERLRSEAAVAAAQGPVLQCGYRFEADAAARLVDDLLSIRVEVGEGRVAQVRGEFVDPVQLQVVCHRLWHELPPGTREITVDHVRALRGDNEDAGRNVVDNALMRFFDDAIGRASRAGGATEGQLRTWCEKSLLTATGTRAFVHRGQFETAGLPNEALDLLESDHLLASEWRAGARWYELSHDRLVSAVVASNARYVDRRTTVAAEAMTLVHRARLARSGHGDEALLREATTWVDQAQMLFSSIDDTRGVGLSFTERAEILWAMGDAEGAIAALVAAQPYVERSGTQEDLEEVTEFLTAAYAGVGKDAESLRMWDRIGDKAAASAVLLLARAGDRWYGGELDAALADYRRALAMGLPDTRVAEAFNGIGHILADLGRGHEAEQVLQRALELDSGDNFVRAYALNGLGYAVGQTGRFDEALQHFEESLRKEPGNAWAYLNRARIHVLRGALADATVDLAEALHQSRPALTAFKRQIARELQAELASSEDERES